VRQGRRRVRRSGSRRRPQHGRVPALLLQATPRAVDVNGEGGGRLGGDQTNLFLLFVCNSAEYWCVVRLLRAFCSLEEAIKLGSGVSEARWCCWVFFWIPSLSASCSTVVLFLQMLDCCVFSDLFPWMLLLYTSCSTNSGTKRCLTL
jgi:hypothetical protein